MKRPTLSLLALCATFMAAGFAVAQPKSGTPAPAPAAKQQKLLKIGTINGVQANKNFQADVQLVQAQRQGVMEMNDKMEKEKDAKKKAELKKQVDTALAKLNENNAAMAKAYGFSLERNYVMEIETSHLYLYVTDEEAAKAAKAEADEAAKAAKNPKKK